LFCCQWAMAVVGSEQYYADAHSEFQAMGCEGAAKQVLQEGMVAFPSSAMLSALLLGTTQQAAQQKVCSGPAEQMQADDAVSGSKAEAVVLPNAGDTPSYGSTAYWEKRFETEEHYEWITSYQNIKDKFAKACPEKSVRILNLGCGTSRICEEMYDDGYENIVNIDIVEAAVEKMRARNMSRSKMEWYTADVTNMSQFDTASFDVVLDKSTLDAVACCLKNLPVVQMMGEGSRMLKPGGVYVLITLNDTNPDFFKYPHLAYDIERLPLSGDFGEGFLLNHKFCICRKRPEAEFLLESKLPEMLQWAEKFDASEEWKKKKITSNA